jgi:hypothetical protein
MATASNPQEQNQGQQTQASTGTAGSPISNDAYNVISALQAKLEGLEAYRKYSKDPNGQLWQELTQMELASVGRLVEELERLVKDGRFRMQAPGSAH